MCPAVSCYTSDHDPSVNTVCSVSAGKDKIQIAPMCEGAIKTELTNDLSDSFF